VSKPGFASEKVMRNYLNALLIDEEECQTVAEPDDAQLRPVAKLLEKVNVIERPVQPTMAEQVAEQVKAAKVAAKIKSKQNKVARAKPAQLQTTTTTRTVAVERAIEPAKSIVQEKAYRKGEFQALFFDVAGLTVAVPLTELGGIHNMGELNNLPGKPDWFMGVRLHREQKLNVVNTAKWVMPEKYDNDLENNIDYQYIIMLDDSPWGLACEKLVNTITLNQDDVKWRENAGRRPWLAGLIKERMCALLDVSALIKLLGKGQNSLDDLIPAS
jgi:purine-binding chemotaxis protein CheW